MNTTVKISAILLFSLISYNCSSAGTTANQNDGGDKKKVKVLIFDRTEDGKDVKYKAQYEDDKLVSIERNGQKIGESEMDKYSDIIDDEIDNMQADKEEKYFDYGPGNHQVFKFKHLPDSTLSINMHKMKDELKKLRKIEINFNDFDNLKQLDSLDIPEMNIKVDVDFDKLRADLDKVKDELGKLKIELNELKKKK